MEQFSWFERLIIRIGAKVVIPEPPKRIQHLYKSFLTAIPVYAVILIVLSVGGFELLPRIQEPTMILLAGVFGGVAVVVFVLGVYSPRWILKRYKYKREDWSEPAICHVFYPSLLLFGWIGMMGLALGILGAEFYVAALFFTGSAGGMILTFPTEEKYEKMV